MFLSKDDLKLSYGVDLEIGKTYVDRPVPDQNLYWKKRKLYITPMPGFTFMPIFSDIAFRLGVSKSDLLSDRYFNLVESIMHSAGLLEAEEITWDEHVASCLKLGASGCVNESWYADMYAYFNGEPAPSGLSFGTPFRSLNRADTYLLSLCGLAFDASISKPLIEAWYALITYFLIMDDLEDIRKDFEKQEENAFIDAGLNLEGVDKIMVMINKSYETMMLVNPVMANRIDHKRSTIDIPGIIASFLSERTQA